MAATKTFDLFDIPLTATRLIEASAGTGKTYTIAGLFVRLLLEKSLRVEQILVVTYTKAATAELKTRIRLRLTQARSAFATGRADDDLMAGLLEKTPDHRRAFRLLCDALADFDRAAIFTIHGFCQRILHENAFEAGSLYDTELITDPRELQREIAEDYWRSHFYQAPPEWIRFAARNGIGGPEDFEKLIANFRFLEASIIPRPVRPELSALQPYRRQFEQLADRWPAVRQEVLTLLLSPGLDGRSYGSLKTAGDRPSKRELRLAALAAEMDRFCGSPQPVFPPVDALDRFTASRLQNSTRQRHDPPQHDLFDCCEALQRTGLDLEAEMRQLMLHLQTGYFRWAADEMDRRKKLRNIQHYDDLLTTVKKALSAGAEKSAAPLVEKARMRYRAALVDEFQDTDSVQYDIFSALFGTDRHLLFIIGDPKQSIYSFRGADIYAYLRAADRATSRYTLGRNWRSAPGLIQAVNTLFADRPAPFVFDAITCEPTRPGRPPEAGQPSDEPALVLWYLPSPGSGPLNKSDAVAIISEAVADEIVRLVGAANHPVAAADIAVLVRTNRQAQIVKASLTRRRIPAVLYSSGSIFETREAEELQRLLTGIVDSGSEARFRAALATDIMGVSGDALARADDQPDRWELRRHRFQQYADMWKQLGFIRMFRTLLVREKVRGRLLAFADGERRLTNLLHLAELMHREAHERQPPPAGLLKWLVERRSPDAPGHEEYQLRLESDALAVKIVTVHKSKGLEYPIVFCPFGWDASTLRAGDPAVFHRPDADRQLTVDLGSEQLAAHRLLAQHELLSENLRLLYVAVTRARQRCYLAWGRINMAGTSALAYLLHLADTAGEDDMLAAMRQRFAGMDNDDLLADLHDLARRSKGSISVQPLPQPAPIEAPADVRDEADLAFRGFEGQIESDWKISSYSAMVSGHAQDAVLPDHDADLFLPAASESRPLEPTRRSGETRSIFDFPRGARAGIFFHDLLEQIDFSPSSEPARAETVAAKLKQYGYDRRWQPVVRQTVEKLLQVKLPATAAAGETFSLSDVADGERVGEMEFYFPQKKIRPQDLAAIFARHADARLSPGVSRQMENLSFAPTGGFLMGYVDMLFRCAGRFYLLDWKSNYLGDRLADYAAEQLTETMIAEHYILQYCLYTVAANRYLKLHWPGYRYDKHFGGVFYLFIRGVEPASGDATGIFCDRPDEDLIHALDDALAGGGAESVDRPIEGRPQPTRRGI